MSSTGDMRSGRAVFKLPRYPTGRDVSEQMLKSTPSEWREAMLFLGASLIVGLTAVTAFLVFLT
jgi:hypothetical protein